MKNLTLNRRWVRSMTLVELLVVLVLIGVVAALLLPTNPGRHGRGNVYRAKLEMQGLIAAMLKYENSYNRLPIADTNTDADISMGMAVADIGNISYTNGVRIAGVNSEPISLLMDMDGGVNTDHKINEKKIVFLEARIVNDTRQPGVSSVDRQFRDPWGNPYVMSLDANGDGFVRDAIYGSPTVSSNGIAGPLTNIGGFFQLPGKVMIWSRGPDGKASVSVPANTGVNRDNVVSWR